MHRHRHGYWHLGHRLCRRFSGVSSDGYRSQSRPADTVHTSNCHTEDYELTKHSVPPNLKFVVDDAEDLWIYDQPFDFIHARLMAGCFADWPNFLRQAYQSVPHPTHIHK